MEIISEIHFYLSVFVDKKPQKRSKKNELRLSQFSVIKKKEKKKNENHSETCGMENILMFNPL